MAKQTDKWVCSAVALQLSRSCSLFKNLMNTLRRSRRERERERVDTLAIVFVCHVLFFLFFPSPPIGGPHAARGTPFVRRLQRLAAPHGAHRASTGSRPYRSSPPIISPPPLSVVGPAPWYWSLHPETEDGDAAGGRRHHPPGPWPNVTSYLFGKWRETQWRCVLD